MTAARGRAGWPDHRGYCSVADDSDVDEVRRLVGGTDWAVRICNGCGAVALEQLPALAPRLHGSGTAGRGPGGDAA